MQRQIRIFKSFQEQEEYHNECMRNSTPEQRLRILYQMQQWSILFSKEKPGKRKITIHHGHTKQ